MMYNNYLSNGSYICHKTSDVDRKQTGDIDRFRGSVLTITSQLQGIVS